MCGSPNWCQRLWPKLQNPRRQVLTSADEHNRSRHLIFSKTCTNVCSLVLFSQRRHEFDMVTVATTSPPVTASALSERFTSANLCFYVRLSVITLSSFVLLYVLVKPQPERKWSRLWGFGVVHRRSRAPPARPPSLRTGWLKLADGCKQFSKETLQFSKADLRLHRAWLRRQQRLRLQSLSDTDLSRYSTNVKQALLSTRDFRFGLPLDEYYNNYNNNNNVFIIFLERIICW